VLVAVLTIALDTGGQRDARGADAAIEVRFHELVREVGNVSHW
jgi:hypothetical protein